MTVLQLLWSFYILTYSKRKKNLFQFLKRLFLRIYKLRRLANEYVVQYYLLCTGFDVATGVTFNEAAVLAG
jgi:mRNA degradation ribonuclease J1/J2